MGGVVTWGGTCPACGRVFRGLRDGVTMGTHTTDFYLPFSNRRETCRYSRGTREDAVRQITPLMRRTAERIRAVPVDQRSQRDREWLEQFETKENR